MEIGKNFSCLGYLENSKIEEEVKHFEHLGLANWASNCSKYREDIDWDWNLPFVYTKKGLQSSKI